MLYVFGDVQYSTVHRSVKATQMPLFFFFRSEIIELAELLKGSSRLKGRISSSDYSPLAARRAGNGSQTGRRPGARRLLPASALAVLLLRLEETDEDDQVRQRVAASGPSHLLADGIPHRQCVIVALDAEALHSVGDVRRHFPQDLPVRIRVGELAVGSVHQRAYETHAGVLLLAAAVRRQIGVPELGEQLVKLHLVLRLQDERQLLGAALPRLPVVQELAAPDKARLPLGGVHTRVLARRPRDQRTVPNLLAAELFLHILQDRPHEALGQRPWAGGLQHLVHHAEHRPAPVELPAESGQENDDAQVLPVLRVLEAYLFCQGISGWS
jgi:hypothetical protein